MTVVGRLMKALGRGGYKEAWTSISGPSSYTSGGFDLTISELSSINFAVVQAMNPGAAGYLALIKSISGNTVTIQVYEVNQDVNEGGSSTYTVTIKEVGAGTDLSGVTFVVHAVGS